MVVRYYNGIIVSVMALYDIVRWSDVNSLRTYQYDSAVDIIVWIHT